MAQVKISTDKGCLRVRIPSAISKIHYGKKEFYKALGRTDSEKNRQWAEAIALKIQADIDHPDNLFDPSLQKYLGVKVATRSINSQLSPPALKDIWLEFVEYKYRIGQIGETTYRTRYKRTFSNWLEPYYKEPLSSQLAEKIVIDLIAKQVYAVNLKKLISALEDACDRAIAQGKLAQNYFAGLTKTIRTPKKSLQLQEEEDYKAFSKQERDAIVQAFYLSDRKAERHIGDLVAFLFLTGCRLGEAFALKFDDLKPDWIVFDESYSSECRILKSTKTDTIRIFKTQGYRKLQKLIAHLIKNRQPKQEFVFVTQSGKQYDRAKLSGLWIGKDKGKNGKDYYSLGVVARLAKEGIIFQYLKPSATRHTFITLQANSGVDLKLLADSVGNSIDVIYNHYLGVDKNAVLMDI
jgi:integrase